VLKVKDIMTPQAFVLNMDVSVDEAAWAMARRGLGCAPVTDNEGRLAGFLSKTDMVDPAWSDWVARNKATVGDIMNPTILALYEDDPAIEAARGMAERGIHHVVVVDHAKVLVGIVSSLDLVKALARGACFDTEHAPGAPVIAAGGAAP
jgi:CBS domain-containing protein